MYLTVNAQSFSFTSEQTQMIIDKQDTIYVFKAMVKNLSDQDINVQGFRRVQQIPFSWSTRLCFGNCYDESTDNTDITPIFAHDSLEFELDVIVSAETGSAVIDIDMKSGLETYTLTFNLTTSAISVDTEMIISDVFQLYDNYPNPFNPTTNIFYKIGINAFVKLNIYNIQGKKIHTLVNKKVNKGNYQTFWNGKNVIGIAQSAGVYYYQLQIIANNQTIGTITKKMVLMK